MSEKITPALARAASNALEKFAARGDRRLIPRGHKGAESQYPYLYRNFLEADHAPDSQPSLLLHKFVASDSEHQLHNHPWKWSISFILVGSYRETRSNIGKRLGDNLVRMKPPLYRVLNPGDVNHIRANDFHRVELLNEHVWTLFLHGPRVQEWGFLTENYKRPVRLRHFEKGRTRNMREKVTRATR